MLIVTVNYFLCEIIITQNFINLAIFEFEYIKHVDLYVLYVWIIYALLWYIVYI